MNHLDKLLQNNRDTWRLKSDTNEAKGTEQAEDRQQPNKLFDCHHSWTISPSGPILSWWLRVFDCFHVICFVLQMMVELLGGAATPLPLFWPIWTGSADIGGSSADVLTYPYATFFFFTVNYMLALVLMNSYLDFHRVTFSELIFCKKQEMCLCQTLECGSKAASCRR